jgi:hypothetical protein
MAFIAVPLAVTVGGMFLMQMLAPKQRLSPPATRSFAIGAR